MTCIQDFFVKIHTQLKKKKNFTDGDINKKNVQNHPRSTWATASVRGDVWCDQKLHNCRLNEWIQNLRQGRRVNVCNRAAAVLERISNKYTVKASISVIGQRGSFVLTVSRCDTVAILSSRQTSMVGLSSLPLCYHLIWPAVPGPPLAPVPMLAMTTPLHICQRSKPTLKTGREGVLLKPTGVPPVLLVISHCHVAAVQAATYRRHSSGLAVLSWKQNMSWNLKSMQCFTNNAIKKYVGITVLPSVFFLFPMLS